MGAVRITQLDGKLPNLALARIASWHAAKGDAVIFRRTPTPDLLEPAYDVVYASSIFTDSSPLVVQVKQQWPNAIVGGTGSGSTSVVEDVIGDWRKCDYSFWPDYRPSLGFTARGCRMKCKFCVVPGKEGRPRVESAIADIWRGPGHPKLLHLLDNDFFGQPEADWRARITEIRDGGFKVCFNQGINVRVINEKAAEALASVEYRDDQFKERRLYTAWDCLDDERVFFRGVEKLNRAGVPSKHIMAYMLIGFSPNETMDQIIYRFNRMANAGIKPYPMVYSDGNGLPYKQLKAFQRWAVTGLYRALPFSDYDVNIKSRKFSGDDGQSEFIF